MLKSQVEKKVQSLGIKKNSFKFVLNKYKNMNIFFLDTDVKLSAQYHVDKHCTKMCVEYAQLLCSVHHFVGGLNDIPYKMTHKNHPCAIWARETLPNYLYLCELGLALGEEYTFRYGKTHKSIEVIKWCLINKPNIPDTQFTTPPLAMPDEFKVVNHCHPITSVILSYRKYYKGAKSSLAAWKKREIPSWFSGEKLLDLQYD
jgi:hypothetical protein